MKKSDKILEKIRQNNSRTFAPTALGFVLSGDTLDRLAVLPDEDLALTNLHLFLEKK
jgi:hypothetical protein